MAVAVPSIMYTVEAIDINGWGEIEKWAVTQNRLERLGLGCNRYVAIEAIRGEMGWSSFEERRDKAVSNFRVRIGLMDGNRWVRRIFECGRDTSNWGGVCKRIIRKYNAEACLGIGLENIDRGGLGRVFLRVRGLG